MVLFGSVSCMTDSGKERRYMQARGRSLSDTAGFSGWRRLWSFSQKSGSYGLVSWMGSAEYFGGRDVLCELRLVWMCNQNSFLYQ